MNPNEFATDLQSLFEIQRQNLDKSQFELQRAYNRRREYFEALESFSISRAISALATNSRLHGADEALFQQTAEATGRPFSALQVMIPFSALTRDLNISNANQGGYLKASAPQAEAFDNLRPWSVVLQGGVQVMSGLQGDVAISRTGTNTTVSWMTNETTAATPSQPVINQNITMAPRIAIGTVNVSRQLRLQSSADAFTARELMRTAGTIVDQAVINGPGTGGAPTGVLNTSGLSTQSGTSLAWAGIVAMKRMAAAANAPDDSITFLAPPAVRELLEKREVATGSGLVWQGNSMAGCRAIASTDVPASTLLCGPLSSVLLGLWTDGLEIQVSPYDPTQFRQGTIQVRVLLAVDVALMCDPAAFVKSTSIT